MARVLLAGESWSTTSTHSKGFDSFITTTYAEGAGSFIAALELIGHEVTFMPSHIAADKFPSSSAELDLYDVVVLSDIGSNTLLLSTSTFIKGQKQPNRLQILSDWIESGGNFLMVGGYLSFQGIDAKANYRNTVIANVLPILMEQGDDRSENPEGVSPKVVSDHHIVKNIEGNWPAILGYQKLIAKPGTQVILEVDGNPLLVIGSFGKGRVAAFASDLGPHWIPNEFLEWHGFQTLWQQTIKWLSEK